MDLFTIHQMVGLTWFENDTIVNSASVFERAGNIRILSSRSLRLYSSIDNGYSWNLLHSFPFEIRSISFLDSLNGFVLCMDGNTNYVYATSDGGNTFILKGSTGLNNTVFGSYGF